MLEFYPPSPPSVPDDFLKPSRVYIIKTVVTLVAVVLFMAFYLSMVAGSIWLVYKMFMFVTDGSDYVVFKILMLAGSVMLAVFLLKSLFKRHKVEQENMLEIKESDQPELFAFIRRLCEETGAPFPRKIFLNSDVNAAVFYNSSILSLFFPVKKNLLIGAGLVNTLNLSEFKAVLAHEFGHFSQRTMKIGSYILLVNRIIFTIVEERDSWDDALRAWASIDPRISFPAYILIAIIWVLRKFLALVFKIINLVYSSLSRQMEFNADLVAVSVTGSDAIVDSLAKIDKASKALNETQYYLYNATENQKYSKDMFSHQKRIFDEDMVVEKTKDRGKTVFNKEEFVFMDPYSTHPSDFEREENAKKYHIVGVKDKRSAWKLFNNSEKLRLELTTGFYNNVFPEGLPPEAELSDPAVLDEYIEQERKESIYHPSFHGLYDHRNYIVEDIVNFDYFIERWAVDELANLFNDEVKAKVAEITKDFNDFNNMTVISEGYVKNKTYIIEGQTYTKKQIGNLLKDYEKKIENHDSWIKDFDRKVAATCLKSERLQGHDDFLKAFEFHADICKIYLRFTNNYDYFVKLVNDLNARGEVNESEFNSFEVAFNDVGEETGKILSSAEDIIIEGLNNIESSKTLREYIAPETVYIEGALDSYWVNELGNTQENILRRTLRILHKSTYVLLSKQADILFTTDSE
ncbi:M48 family metalloprotease [Myxococcota bacterium]|nr:M48 family metalloprotease [Myxococcota bacterium]MBU1380008.1 M48 family metalloprotease [Myxococcota bacterium]MBU1496765.1 M48 family metalloprotease [Myxococcota bacterium]